MSAEFRVGGIIRDEMDCGMVAGEVRRSLVVWLVGRIKK